MKLSFLRAFGGLLQILVCDLLFGRKLCKRSVVFRSPLLPLQTAHNIQHTRTPHISLVHSTDHRGAYNHSVQAGKSAPISRNRMAWAGPIPLHCKGSCNR